MQGGFHKMVVVTVATAGTGAMPPCRAALATPAPHGPAPRGPGGVGGPAAAGAGGRSRGPRAPGRGGAAPAPAPRGGGFSAPARADRALVAAGDMGRDKRPKNCARWAKIARAYCFLCFFQIWHDFKHLNI